jgi:LacI family transcriptional regulator
MYNYPKRFGEIMNPTIRDVAKKLNISITTVSRALDGYDDVSEGTRNLVILTAHEMGYVPNRAARQLRRQRTDTIGYIIPDSGAGFADPFFSEFIGGLGDEASSKNYDLLVTTAEPDSLQEKALYQRWVQGGKVDGMIINRVRLTDWRLDYLSGQNIPFVALERSTSHDKFVGMEVDSYSGVIELMAYLINKGHSRIAYIGGDPELKIDFDRRRGYYAGLASASIKADTSLIVNSYLTSEGGYQAAINLLNLNHPPTAVVCVNDLIATGVLHAAHERGLKVGRDLAVAGFDGVAGSAHTEPPLTTLDQPVYDIARQLVGMLLNLVMNVPLEEQQVKIQPKLLLRASTGE